MVDYLIPILFEYNTSDFTSHGIGDLVDCIECVTRQTDEGEYELSFSYPINGALLNELTIGRLIYVKANPWQSNQIFRIYGYEKVIGGRITVNCQHISYDLVNIPIKKFKSSSSATCNTVLQNMKSNAIDISGLSINKFTFSSNISGTAQVEEGYFEVDTPSSARSVLLDGDKSIKGCFGGDLVFNNYNVELRSMAGEDRGVTIEYGIDLMDLEQEENISEMITGVLPYFTYTADNDNNDELITYGDIQYASGTFITHKISPLDLTSYFPNQAEHTSPTKSQLNTKAQEWIAAEKDFGEPEINLTVSYATLGQDVRLYDAVTVRFVKMGIDVKSKVHSYKYDVLNERVIEVEVGKTKSSFLFNLEDASRLKKGLLPPERIKNRSITSEKYAPGSISGSAIASGGIGAGSLAPKSITEEKMDDNAVASRAIQEDTIKVYHIVNGAIVTDKISANAVTTNKVLNKAITYAKSNYQGTLDQVGINQSDIAAINDLFVGTMWANVIYCSYLESSDSVIAQQYMGVGDMDVWPRQALDARYAYKDHGHTGYAPSSHTHSGMATTSTVSNYIGYHENRCKNYSSRYS